MTNIKWIAALTLLVVVFATGLLIGRAQVQGAWDKVKLEAEASVAKVQAEQAKETVKVVTEYVDRVKVVKVKGDTIIKEVPVYVTQEADSNCTINRGFVELHDAAANNRLPIAAGNLDEAAPGIKLSTVGTTVADNYTRCHENAEQLRALQGWALNISK